MNQNKVIELFGNSVAQRNVNWGQVVADQQCPFIGRRCYKVRKSDPRVSIGSCTVNYGSNGNSGPVVICPTRLIDRRQIFVDCLHLLTMHEIGNELHIVPEVGVPGGKIDYFLVSVRNGLIRDFVGIELQTLDTTGTVWPERQRLLRELGVPRADDREELSTGFGMNWKMTAKTILVQMHHKIQTFEHVNKKLVLVLQDRLLDYMMSEFRFSHMSSPGMRGDSMHIHAYAMLPQADSTFRLALRGNLSTDAAGIETCLGLQAEARIELEHITVALQSRISGATLFSPV